MPAKKVWTEAAILDAVATFLARTGVEPTRSDFLLKRHELPSLRVVERAMRSWQEPAFLLRQQQTTPSKQESPHA